MINILREDSKKSAFEYPHLEEILVGKPYALTINPAYQHTSFTDSYITHMDTISLFFPYANVVLRPEISTKTTRLHYHGTVTFKKYSLIAPFYYFIIPKLKDQCTFTIKPIADYEWSLYCVKSRHIMRPYLENIKLPYKITNSWRITMPIKITAIHVKT